MLIFLLTLGPQPREWCYLHLGQLTSSRISHKQAQRFVSEIILEPIQLMININHCIFQLFYSPIKAYH